MDPFGIRGATAANPLQIGVGYTNEDYVPIAAVTEIPSVLAVGEDSEYATTEELLEDAVRAFSGPAPSSTTP